MDKQQLRRDLLNGMIRCSEEVSMYHYVGPSLSGVRFLDRCPVAFRPGVGDKYLFNLIIDKVIDNIISEEEDIKLTNPDIMGASIMGKFYYPDYGGFDEQKLGEARRS